MYSAIDLDLSDHGELQHHETDTNYYSLYDSCQKAVGEIYSDVWNDIMSESVDTVVLENSMKQIGYDRDFTGLRSFVVENTMHSRPHISSRGRSCTSI
ncbi:MAG: hypothetical protein V8Q42_00440 [Anaerovoracaceae bacterium]